ncbi:MAG: hypothetical protein ACXIUM_14390 [Wenzhouxiangella sp.]
MSPIRLMAGAGLLAVAAAASGIWWQNGLPGLAPAGLAADGIGPLRLDTDFRRAERLAFRLAPDSAFSGPGCSGLDEIRFDTLLGDFPVTLMAMAEDGRIREVEAGLMTPGLGHSLADCLSLRDAFAAEFTPYFGAVAAQWQINKPVSQEHWAQSGPVLIQARWFPAGGSCNISAHFGWADGTGLRPELASIQAPESVLDL